MDRTLNMTLVSPPSTLADEVIVLPGHGEQSSLGRERRSNPYLLR
jgi:hypothetical protein